MFERENTPVSGFNFLHHFIGYGEIFRFGFFEKSLYDKIRQKAIIIRYRESPFKSVLFLIKIPNYRNVESVPYGNCSINASFFSGLSIGDPY